MSIRARHYTWIIAVFLLSSLVFSRVYKGTVTLYDYGDDDQYWAFSHSLIYQGNLDFAHESLRLFRESPQKIVWLSPFPGLLWSPAVLLGKGLSPVVSRLPGVNQEEVHAGTSAYQRLLVSAFSACLTLGGLLFLYATLAFFLKEDSALAGTLLLFLSTPILYYTFRRPLMAHSAELFSLALFAYCSLRFSRQKTRFSALMTGTTGAVAVGVRYPNIFMVGSWFLMLLSMNESKTVVRRDTAMFVLIGGFFPVLAQLFIWKATLGTWTNHNGAYSFEPAHLTAQLAVSGNTLRTIAQFCLGKGWGLVWMETPIILAAWMTIRGGFPHARSLRILFLTGVLPLIILTANNPYSMGACYGHRYLLAKGLWTAFGLGLFYEVYGKSRWAKALPFALCVFPLLAYLLFESGPETLTLHREEGWGNSQFAVQVLWTLLHDPKQLCFALTGNPVAHVLLWIFSKTIGLAFLPPAVRLKVTTRLEAISLPALLWYLGWIWTLSLSVWGALLYFSNRHRNILSVQWDLPESQRRAAALTL